MAKGDLEEEEDEIFEEVTLVYLLTELDFMFSFKNHLYLQVQKVNCRLTRIGRRSR